MLYLVIWFVGFCLFVGYYIADGTIKSEPDGAGFGVVIIGLFWPILIPFAIGIGLSSMLMEFLIKKFKK